MGALLDEFDAARAVGKLAFEPDVMFRDTTKLEWTGYHATVTAWQEKEWRMAVSFQFRGNRRDVTGLTVWLDTDRDTVENAALDAIRADIVKVEFMEEGPAKLAKLEGEVAALRAEIAALRQSTSKAIDSVSILGFGGL